MVIKLKMRERKWRCGLFWQRSLNQEGVKQTGHKTRAGYINYLYDTGTLRYPRLQRREILIIHLRPSFDFVTAVVKVFWDMTPCAFINTSRKEKLLFPPSKLSAEDWNRTFIWALEPNDSVSKPRRPQFYVTEVLTRNRHFGLPHDQPREVRIFQTEDRCRFGHVCLKDVTRCYVTADMWVHNCCFLIGCKSPT
jgi:hypothetical protein